MAIAQSLTIGRFFLDVPLDIDPIQYQDFLVYVNMVNRRHYKYEHELVIGNNLRVFFDADKKNFKPVTYDMYLAFLEEELDGSNTR